ncbi:FkbM family methyltransferase [Saccharopolyspora erythraea NRRL 2338]|uniref:Methyltransferase n=2 Tax=Saccharopolyspora erythraea TaxID=1836 RepID=A4FKJ9_SACEN|nr:FkbM family methyltransferase [Saccharopolyspora erythraea NRRL 2338]CAM04574.1 putative methyltransferase [Saccharopolyspora erythraea NRRL 2338]
MHGLGDPSALAGVPYVPEQLFAQAAPFYARYRPGYPAELVELLAERTGLDSGDLVLDVGCGTGQLALPLARRVRQVVAVDPQPGMLDHAREAARRAGVGNIDWRQADASALARLGVADARAAFFGASFHWTDRADRDRPGVRSAG